MTKRNSKNKLALKFKLSKWARNFMKHKLHYYYNMVGAMRITICSILTVSIITAFSTEQSNAISFSMGAGALFVINLISSTLILRKRKSYIVVILYIVIVMSASLIFTLEMMYESLPHDSKISMLSYGIMTGLLISFTLLSRTPWYCSFICFLCTAVYWEIRLANFEEVLGNRLASSITLSSIMLLITYVFYKQDNLELAEFIKLEKKQRDLLYYKDLIKEVLPNQILILSVEDHKESSVIFTNDSAKKLFKTGSSPEILKCLERLTWVYSKSIEELASPGTPQHFECFTDFLLSNKKLLSLNNFIKYQADYELEKKTEETMILESENMERLAKIRFEISCGIIEWDTVGKAVIVIMNDISKTKKITELEVLHKKKDNLLASVSHSLRTPLNGITGMIEITKERMTTKTDKKNLNIALNSANTLKLFISDLLDMSKISKTRLTLNLKLENLWQALKEVTKLVKYHIKQKGLLFYFDYELDKSLNISFDKSRLQQILLNILNNAIKFTTEGKIHLEVHPDRGNSVKSEQLEFASCNSNNQTSELIISVTDTGCGIKEENKNKIFKVFMSSQAQGNLTGVGLGLSISNKLVRMLNPKNHDGIKFESKFGAGSKFWFTLPVPENTRVNSNKLNSINEGEREPLIIKNFQETCLLKVNSENKVRSLRALLVDDDPVNLLVLCKYMEAMGVKYYEKAENGSVALEITQNAAKNNLYYDFVLMDCNMPVMNGYEASKIIKRMAEDKIIKPLKIFAVTANVTETDKNKCLSYGMDYVFTKPLLKGEFIPELKRLIFK